MRACMTTVLLYLWCLPSDVFAGTTIIVQRTVPVNHWYYSVEIDALVPKLKERLGGDVMSIHPASPPDATFETVVRGTWNDSDVVNAVQTAIGGASNVTVIGLDLTFSSDLTTAHPTTKFLTLNVGGAPKDWSPAQSNYNTYTVPTLRAAYLNGVIMALDTAGAGKKIEAFIPNSVASAREELTAFVQGVADVDSTICVVAREVEWKEAVPGAPLFPDVTDRVTALTGQALDKGVYAFYTLLGPYNAAVLEKLKEKSDAFYAVYAATGAGAAIPSKWDRTTDTPVVLTTATLDWENIIVEALQRGDGFTKDYSESLWTARWGGAPTNHPVALTNCTTAGGHRSRISIVNEVGRQRPLPHGKPSALPRNSCIRMGVVSQATRNLSAGCLPPRKGTIRLVGVGIYLNNLGDVDMKQGSVYVDFNLYLRQHKNMYASVGDAQAASTNGVCNPADFAQNEWVPYVKDTQDIQEAVNFVSMDRVKGITPSRSANGSITHYRVQGVHYFSPDLSSWPLDTQELKLVIEESTASENDNVTLVFCLMKDFSGLAPTARYFPGMEVNAKKRMRWETSFTCWPHLKYPEQDVCSPDLDVRWPADKLPGADESCTCLGGTQASSRLAYVIDFTRPFLPTFMKTFLPPLFITMVNLGVYFLTPKKYETRLGVCGSTLVSAVMFHVSISSQTPPSRQPTWADRFMLVVYWNNLASFIAVFVQSCLEQGGFPAVTLRLFQFTRSWGLPTAVLSFFAPLFCESFLEILVFVAVVSVIVSILIILLRPIRNRVYSLCMESLLSYEQKLERVPVETVEMEPLCHAEELDPDSPTINYSSLSRRSSVAH